MRHIISERLRQGTRTSDWPAKAAAFPARFRGRPVIDASKCPEGCRDCAAACPTAAIDFETGAARLDLGKCLFCPLCAEACPQGAVSWSTAPELAVRRREDLLTKDGELRLADALDAKMRSLFGRSLKLREVCAGSCNGCDQELVATGNVVFDLGRFGIQFVASPRHADGLVVTGPVTANMRHALLETYAAVPPPKIVIVVGACAISGGPFAGGPETNSGVGDLLPVDLFIPGCPPHPITILDGLLRLLGRLKSESRTPRV
jgi:Ni,Fe-hydrogenase III small subunit/formate hydrogenlyase subunit 6/NADH:ubiquinone oxidoreductase subunit I